MREFHEEQIRGLKAIYKTLVNDNNLTLTLSRIGYPDLFIEKKEKSFLLLYSDDKRLRNFYYLIYTLMLLASDGDVLFVNCDVIPINQSEKANNDVHYKEHIIKDEAFLYFLNNNWNKTIIFSSALIDYIYHGKTPDQRRFEDTMKKAKISIGIAILVGLIGIAFNIFALCKATKFDNAQLNQIEQTLHGVIRDEITKDTLKIKVVDVPKIQPIQYKIPSPPRL